MALRPIDSRVPAAPEAAPVGASMPSRPETAPGAAAPELVAPPLASQASAPPPATTQHDATRAQGVASQLAARMQGAAPVDAIAEVAPGPSASVEGALLGRLLSNVATPLDGRLLDALVTAGEVDPSVAGLERYVRDTYPQPRSFTKRLMRFAAAVKLFQTPPEALSPLARRTLATLGEAPLKPATSYVPPSSSRDGAFENFLYGVLAKRAPKLAEATLEHHPYLAAPEDLIATSALADAIATQQGAFLRDYNVVAVMHHMGRTPGWLSLLRDKLGLEPSQYVGVTVPYSTSDVAVARERHDGFRTLEPSNGMPTTPRELIALLRGESQTDYDTDHREVVQRAIDEAAALHAKNGKPILIVDDGGYAVGLIHGTPIESICRVVEWTKRGGWKHDAIERPRYAFVNGGDSGPKTRIEPPFIIASQVEHLEALVQERLGRSLYGLKIAVVGQGDLGRIASRMLAAQGAKVTATDRDPHKLEHLGAGVHVERDIKRAVAGQDVVLALTGRTSLPPEVQSAMAPNTIMVSGSSSDIETRSGNSGSGSWQTDAVSLSIHIGNTGTSGRTHAAPTRVLQDSLDIYQRTIQEDLGKLGINLQVDMGVRETTRSGFVVNLSGRAREMPLGREELILMNVTEAMAQVASPTPADAMDREREARIETLYAEHHPDELAFARRWEER